MPNRLSQAIAAARQAVSAEPVSETPEGAMHGGLPGATAVLAIGHGQTDPVQATLAFAGANLPEGTTVLLISSSSAIVEARVPGLVCEYLPPAADLAEATGDGPEAVQHYRRRRLQSMLEKWLVTDCRWLGDEAADLVAAVRSEPRLAVTEFGPLPETANQDVSKTS